MASIESEKSPRVDGRGERCADGLAAHDGGGCLDLPLLIKFSSSTLAKEKGRVPT